MDINIELAEKYLKNQSKPIKTTNKDKSIICLYDFFCFNNIKICEKLIVFYLVCRIQNYLFFMY